MITNIFKELKESKQLKGLALKAYNNAATRMNDRMCETFNKLWESKGRELGSEAYQKAYENLFNTVWEQEAKKLSGKFTTEQILKAFGLFKIIIK